MRRSAQALIVSVAASALFVTGAVAQDASLETDPLGDFTHQPGTTVEPAGLEWERVTLDESQVPARRYGLIAWSGGFAFMEHPRGPGRRTHAVWTSESGRGWVRTELPGAVKNPFRLEPFRDGLVLVSEQRRGYGHDDMKMDIWRSADGVKWRRVGSVEGAAPGSDLGLWPRSFLAFDDRLAVLGYEYRLGGGSGGRSDALSFIAAGPRSALVREPRSRAWSSGFGKRWREGKVIGLDASDGAATLIGDAITTPSRAWLARDGAEAAILRSKDGLRWREVAALPEHFEEGTPQGLAWADGALLMYGENADPEGSESCGNRLGIWRLDTPSGEWSELLDRQPAVVHGMGTDDGWLVVSGKVGCGGRWAWVLVSPDGGRSWDPELSWVGAPDTCVGEVAIHDRTVAMFDCGQRSDDQGPVMWVAPLPATSTMGDS